MLAFLIYMTTYFQPIAMKRYQLLAMAMIMVIALTSHAAFCQNDTAKNTPAKSIFYNGGMQYLSNLTYAGRSDNSSVPVLLPNFTVISKTGLFLNATGYFDLSGANSQSEGLSVTPGYVFSFDTKKEYGGSISATKYFITS